MDGRENGGLDEKKGSKHAKNSLEAFNSLLGKVAIALSELEMALIKIAAKKVLREKVLMEDDEDVLWLIRELQGHLTQINSVIILFDENAAYEQIQDGLDATQMDLGLIKKRLASLDGLKNDYDLQERNQTIGILVKKLRSAIIGALRKLDFCVNGYNKNNHKKLRFNIRWHPRK